MAEISIIVPIYNVEKYIKSCIESIKAQTVTEWELILVDDGSTDNSLAIAYQYSEYDSRIMVVDNGHHGVSYARNTGISIANSERIMFVDSDDTLEPNALEVMMSAGKNMDFILASYKTIYTESGVCLEHNVPAFSGSIQEFCKSIDVYFGAAIIQGPCWKIFKKSIIIANNIRFPEDIDFGEDAYFVYNYMKFIQNVIVIEDMVYNYYVYGKSLSHGFRNDKYYINLMLNEMFCALLDFYNIANVREKKCELNCNAFSSFLNDCALCKNWFTAVKEIKKALGRKETQDAYMLSSNDAIKQKVIRLLVKKNSSYLLLMFGKCNQVLLKIKNRVNLSRRY